MIQWHEPERGYRFKKTDGWILPPLRIADQFLGLGAEKLVALGGGVGAGVVAQSTAHSSGWVGAARILAATAPA